MAKTMSYLVCPVCVHNLSFARRGRSRRKYNLWAKDQAIVYIRDCSGGKKPHLELPRGKGPKPGWPPGSGFPIIDRISWDKALENEEYREALLEIKEQVKKLASQLLTKEEKKELIEKLSPTDEESS